MLAIIYYTEKNQEKVKKNTCSGDDVTFFMLTFAKVHYKQRSDVHIIFFIFDCYSIAPTLGAQALTSKRNTRKHKQKYENKTKNNPKKRRNATM